jgi:hypothetical protein
VQKNVIIGFTKQDTHKTTKGKQMHKYQMTVVFTADRELSEDELDILLTTCVVQIEEPVEEIGGDDADYSTTIQSTDIFKVGN